MRHGRIAPKTGQVERLDFLIWEAAMSLYEFLTLLLEAIKIVIDIITRLLRRRKKGKRIKK